jgi:ribosome-binding protein aMBF1 (putative translation factor)
VSVVNATSNVVQLCRNCHWEFDHGYLSAEDIKRKDPSKNVEDWTPKGKPAKSPQRLPKGFVGPAVLAARKAREKAAWPTDEALASMIWQIPATLLGKQLGVSDKAILLRCKRRGIGVPGRGYWAKVYSERNTDNQ